MRLIGRGSGQAEACSGADRGRRRASWPKSEPTCLSHVVALVAPLELNIRAALGPNKLAYILQHAHLQGGNQARAAGAGEAGRVRRGLCVVRRKRAVSCVRAIEGAGAGRRAHPNEQVVVRRLEIARDVNVVGELVITWGGGGARCGERCGAREQRGFGARARAGALPLSVGLRAAAKWRWGMAVARAAARAEDSGDGGQDDGGAWRQRGGQAATWLQLRVAASAEVMVEVAMVVAPAAC